MMTALTEITRYLIKSQYYTEIAYSL